MSKTHDTDAIADIIKTTPFRWEEGSHDLLTGGCWPSAALWEPPSASDKENAVVADMQGAQEIGEDRLMVAIRLCELFENDPTFNRARFVERCGFAGLNDDAFLEAHGQPSSDHPDLFLDGGDA